MPSFLRCVVVAVVFVAVAVVLVVVDAKQLDDTTAAGGCAEAMVVGSVETELNRFIHSRFVENEKDKGMLYRSVIVLYL